MKTSTIYFYAVGLNEQNLAFNKTAFENILAAGKFIDGESNERSITLNQPVAFGTSFQISAANYSIFKSATYIKIVNVDTNTETRFGFINNFLELANGNFSVSYTLDDYTNFILYASEMGVSPHIDGFVERANVPLISRDNGQYKLNTRQVPLTGKRQSKGIKTFFNTAHQFIGVDRALPDGWSCQIYSIDIPKFDGVSHNSAHAHGYVCDYNYKNDTFYLIERLNSNLYIELYDEDGWSVPIVYNDGSNNVRFTQDILFDTTNHRVKWDEMKAHKITDPDDSSILKIMRVDYLPAIEAYYNNTSIIEPYWSTDQQNYSNIFQIKTIAELFPQYSDYDGAQSKVLFVNKQLDKYNCADIYTKEQNSVPASEYYCKAVGISMFANVLKFDLTPYVIAENDIIVKQTNITAYYNNSLYKNIDETRQIKIKYLTAEIEIPQAQYIKDNKIYVEFSGDLETIVIKYDNADLPYRYRSNSLAGTGQNTAFFDLVHVRDYKSYKNAKITGAASLAAGTLSSLLSFGASAASVAAGNAAGVAGMFGSASSLGTNLINNLTKLQGLTPAQLSPANGDFTLTQILSDNKNLDKLLFEIDIYPPENMYNIIRDLEENGALISMAFDDYIANCQMEAFNAVKCSYMEITGIPQQAARRIADAFIGGLTLWTATDVGNKKVINYPA